MNVRQQLTEAAKTPFLFDGGMGTYYSAKCHKAGSGCELANISNPALIEEIHREYIRSGANAIKTNTFASNLTSYQGDEELLQQVISAGYQIACHSAAADTQVFADIGLVTGADDEEIIHQYQVIADCFLQQKAVNYLFETNSSTKGLHETVSYIRTRCPQAFILVSFASLPDGYTRDGYHIRELLLEAAAWQEVDGVGLNCIMGARHMHDMLDSMTEVLEKVTEQNQKYFSVMPNAGYPIVMNNRTFYEGDPAYFAEQLLSMVPLKAAIIGGCCGTTPLHIAEASKRLHEVTKAGVHVTEASHQEQISHETSHQNYFWEKLSQGKKVIAVELDPPRNTDTAKFMEHARQLQKAGIDILTIADCPIGRPRMDSSLLACKIHRELNMDVIPHMTCRDRNLNATKALLLGLYGEGISNVLTVTGDPIPSADRDEVKSVYQFNSRKMSHYIKNLGESELPGPFQIFGALNINAVNFDIQLRIAKDKEQNGMCGFLTQPVLSQEAFENLIRAKEELQGKILGGIMPVLSEKNARFMNNEINGIHVCSQICDLYVGKNREEGEQLAYDISTRIAEEISPYVDGYYIMTPFQRVGLIERIVRNIS